MSETLRYNAAGGATPYLFDAILYPNRSLGRRGLVALIAVILGTGVIIGGVFWSRGVWPVIAFYGLEAIAVWWAFRLNNRAGQIYETIRLTRDRLVVEDHTGRAGRKRWEFNPAGVRVELRHPQEHDSALRIMSQGNGVEVGAFLSPQERIDVAEALKSALRRII